MPQQVVSAYHVLTHYTGKTAVPTFRYQCVELLAILVADIHSENLYSAPPRGAPSPTPTIKKILRCLHTRYVQSIYLIREHAIRMKIIPRNWSNQLTGTTLCRAGKRNYKFTSRTMIYAGIQPNLR